MAKNIRLQNYFHEIKIFHNRSVVALVMSFILISILFARLYYLQIIQNQHYSTLSTNNRVTIEAIPPIRGLIYDTNGEVLAENRTSFNLHIIPEKAQNLEQTLTLLSEFVVLEKKEIKRFNKQVKRKHRFESVPIKFHLSDEEVAILAVNRHRLPGVEVKAQLSRHYPYGKETAHVVGYVGRINEKELKKLSADEKATDYSGTDYIGKLGVEKSYESQLLGQVGFQQVETDVRGRVLRVLERTDPIPGKDLYLNLDIKLQQVAMTAFGEEKGALVAIDPNNGHVLSMVSMPSFDANLFVNGISYKAYKALNTSEDRPLFNRTILGSYPPGSTTKPFFALAGLELEEIGAEEEIFCPGFYRLKGKQHKYRDWKKWGHGKTDMNKAIVESCDVYFYSLAYHLGIDKMHHFMSLFGFGQRSGIDVPGERRGLMPSRQWKRKAKGQVWFPGETLITGIGQGYMLVTPLQLASGVAALSKSGLLYQPQLVKSISQAQHSGIAEQKIIASIITTRIPIHKKPNWDAVIKAMKDVIHSSRGTARRLNKKDMPYTIAGKTGTAQVFTVAQDSEYKEKELAKKLRDHALFVAFAPVNNPKIAIAVIVENGGHGGSVAAPIAGKVIDYYLKERVLKQHDLKHQGVSKAPVLKKKAVE